MSNLDDLLEQEFPVADNYLYLNHAGEVIPCSHIHIFGGELTHCRTRAG